MTLPTLYEPPQLSSSIEVDLSKNEGLVATDSFTIGAGDVARYPDAERLKTLIAALVGVSPSSVLLTAGGDDALARGFQAFAGRSIAATTPSFEMIPRYAAQNRSSLTEIEWWDGPFPVDEFCAVPADLAVVVSPNNPTGSVIAEQDLAAIAASFPTVVLDAAYEEFSGRPLTATALGLDNVVVVRTLSKAYGMAGLRVGYLVGTPELVSRISRFGSPYPISAPSLRIAERSLESGVPDISRTLDRRAELAGLLEGFGLQVLESNANFVLVRQVDSPRLTRSLSALGIAVREFPDRPEMAGCVRITVPRSSEEQARLDKALRTIYEPEALLFDMDGVIADVSGSYRQTIVETAAEFGVELDQADIDAVKEEGDANDDWQLTRLLCLRNGVDVPLAQIISVFESIYQGTNEAPGLKERETLLISEGTLRRLASRLPLGIVTGRPRKDAVELLDRFSIGEWFDTVITREDAPMKPDPAPVAKALAELGVQRAWLLGDTRDDLAAARGAGVLPIGVGKGALAGAATVLATTTQIEEELNETLN